MLAEKPYLKCELSRQVNSNGHWSLAQTVVDAEYAGVFEVVAKESVKGGVGKIQSKRMIKDWARRGIN